MIRNITLLLAEILKEIEKNNPLELVGKGGTTLAIYHLNLHRESQDLDFDSYAKPVPNVTVINDYFKDIFDALKTNGKFSDYKIPKVGFAGTGRYHMQIVFETHKPLEKTKIEINFIDQKPSNLRNKGALGYYSLESLFLQKLLASKGRTEIKDVIDIGCIVEVLSSIEFMKTPENKALLRAVIERFEHLHKNPREWKEQFKQLDIKLRIVDEKSFQPFLAKKIPKLHVLYRKL